MAQDYLRPLEVKNAATGEVATFPTNTLAGLYAFARFLALGKNVENVFNAFKYLFKYDKNVDLKGVFPNDNFFKLSTWFKKRGLEINPYDDYWRSECRNNYQVLNYHYAQDVKKYVHDSLTERLHYRYYTKAFLRKYRRRCEDCGETFYDQISLLRDGHREIAQDLGEGGLLGYGDVCSDCLPSDIVQCDDCHLFTDDYEVINNGDRVVCCDCLNEDYFQCHHCDRYYRYDDDDSITAEDGRHFCCEDCAENDGYWYDDDSEEWTNRSRAPELIGDYHDHKGCLRKVVTKPDKRVRQTLCIGCETEVDSNRVSQRDFDDDWYRALLDDFGQNVCFENDGSLNEGFEIITNPMSENDFMKFDWSKPYQKLQDAGWRSHDTSTCGKHFHFSKGYLGYTELERRNNAKKVCRFFQLYWDEICKIARRGGNSYCYGWNFDITEKTNFYDLANDRYHAVNLTNMYYEDSGIGTIEIRICKGTINAQTTLASADFFLHIVRNAKRIAWKNINNLKLWFKGITNPNTIDYIKSRKAFEGAF